MLNLNNFIIIFMFCIISLFLVINPLLINFILLSELIWISLYLYLIFNSIYSDALLYLALAILLLCIAAGESVSGLTLIMFKFIIFMANNLDSSRDIKKNLFFSEYL